VALLGERGLRGERADGGGGRRAARDFQLLRPLGGGGMGVVWLAVQLSLGREVALKVVRPDQLLFPGARERFRREVETVARLQHPGIVPVYAVGEDRGLPWFAMELVRGLSLGEALHALWGATRRR
jgi:serine/threonine protein kinase